MIFIKHGIRFAYQSKQTYPARVSEHQHGEFQDETAANAGNVMRHLPGRSIDWLFLARFLALQS